MKSILRRAFPLALLCTTLAADEIQLKDGRVLYGKPTEDKIAGTTAITTRDGVVVVPTSDITDTIDDAKLRARLRELAASKGDSPFARLQLATAAHRYGLEAELWQHLDAVVTTADARSPALQSRLDDFLGQLETELLPRKWRTAGTDARVRELLQRHRKGQPGRQAALLELLRREPNADKDLRLQARRNSDSARRLLAVEALVRRGTAGNNRFALRTAILDGSESVRHGAIDVAARHHAATDAVQYLAPGLMHSAAEVRVRTAEAFEQLADASALRLLVIAGPNAGVALAAADQGARAHVAFLNQQSYIRDFDVEVAAASFIADPKIDVLQSGTVLDVSVLGVFAERVRIVRAYRKALERLANSDPGADPRVWATWLQQIETATSTSAPTTPTPTPKKD